MTSLLAGSFTEQDGQIPRDGGDPAGFTGVGFTDAPAWDRVVDALLTHWRVPAGESADADWQPSRHVLEQALAWVTHLRHRIGAPPPTVILPEPAGGIIVEWRESGVIEELTIEADGQVEFTVYRDNRIVMSERLPSEP